MRLIAIPAALTTLFLLCACGPAVQVTSLKPAEVDMSTMRRLVVLEFDSSQGSADSVEDFVVGVIASGFGVDYNADAEVREAATHATDQLVAALVRTGYFTLIGSERLRGEHLLTQSKAQEIGRALGADAILAGDIERADCEIINFSKEERVHDQANGQELVKSVPWVSQRCRVELGYRVVRSADNGLVVRKYFSDERKEEAEAAELYGLHDPGHWYREMIDGFIPEIVRQLAPHEVVETRRLKEDKGYDPDMERATALAKAGNIGAARRLFVQRWRATGNTAAAYNAAILAEAEGDLEAAVALLGELIAVTSDAAILREHRRMLDALAERRQALEQMR